MQPVQENMPAAFLCIGEQLPLAADHLDSGSYRASLEFFFGQQIQYLFPDVTFML